MDDPCKQADILNVICPYCGSSYQAEAEDFSEEERTEECFVCGESYILHDEFEVTHHTRPLPIATRKKP